MEHSPEKLQFIDWDEIKTFKTAKRQNEHFSARWLLEEAVKEWGGIDCSGIYVHRTEERAPYLRAIQGLWIQPTLPSISIAHSQTLACVALIDQGWTVGVDAESFDRPPSPSVFDMMAKGQELALLNRVNWMLYRPGLRRKRCKKLRVWGCILILEILSYPQTV